MCPLANGTVTVDLATGKAHDYAGNSNTAATQFSIVYDGTKPGVTITSVETDPTNSSFEVSIYFDEIVSDFVVGDITVGNGTKGTFTPNGNDQDWTLQINPTADGLVTVDIGADLATDAAGNGNTIAPTFSIIYDGSDPVVNTLYPEDDQLNIALTDNLQITFDENVFEGAGNIEIRHTSDNSLFQSISVATLSGFGTKTITINPNDFLSQIEYYVQVPSGAFEDEASNTFGGISSTTAWSFTTVDANNPVISSVNPIDESGNVSISSNLVITFNENVTAVSAKYITIVNETTTLTHESIEASNTGKVSVSGAVVTIDLGTDFVGETAYHVLIENGAFEDGDSNPFGGISSTTYWNFTTEDIASPTVSGLSPLDEATNVAINSDLVITFNEDVFIGTGNITITDASGPTVHETIAVGSASITNNEVTINPSIDFDGETNYYIEIDATAFKDASDNYYAGISGTTTWNYTTEDITSPSVVVTTIESSPTNSSPFEITITFNEVMVGFVEGDISVSNGTPSNLNTSDNKVFTADITPASDDDVIFIVPVGVASDEAGNGNNISNQITIEYDGTSPTVNITTGQSGIIAADLEITIRFNEEITDLLTGNISVTNGTVTSLSNVIPGTEWDATITPTADGTVTVEILATELTDIAGNSNVLSNQITIEYNASGPQIISLDPINGSSNISVSANLQITFDETSYLNAGYFVDIYESGVGLFEHIDVSTLSGNGTTTITINPVSDFNSETTYYLLIDAEAFIDDLGNGFAGISSTTDWVFTAEDISPPTLSGLSPINGTVDVMVTSNLEITFSENVSKNVGSITIWNDDTDLEHEIIDVSSAQVNVVDNVATINPLIDFIGETNYYVIVGESTFQDLSTNQNNFSGITLVTEWTFVTVDVELPVVSSYSPVDDATGVSILSKLVITFSENVEAGSGNITIYNTTLGANHEVVDINSANVSITYNVVTIDPTFDFDGLSDYYVLIDATAIDDLFGNSYTGIISSDTWSFTTLDASSPYVTAYSPLDGATGLAPDVNLVLTFSEDLVKNVGNITITNETTSSVHETISVTESNVDVSANIVTIDPSIDFDDLSEYHVQIEYGTFHDLEGNSYSGITDDVTWNFTTGDNTAPMVSNFSPADDATGVVLTSNLEINFDEIVNAVSGNIVLYATTGDTHIETFNVTTDISGDGTSTITIDPASSLTNSTDYYVQIDASAFDDNAGNSYAGINDKTTWNFTTLDNALPAISSLSPTDGATNVSVNSNLQITFSEEIVPNSGLINIMDASGTYESIDVFSALVTINSNVVTINPGFDFIGETGYYVLIDNGAFHDLSGNSFAGISDVTIWSFTTEDIVLPSVEITSSESGTVDGNFDVTITFSEIVTGFTSDDVTVVNGSIVTFTETTAGQIWTVTIEPITIGDVIIDISTGVVQDAAGNANTTSNQFSINYDSGVGFEDQIPYEISIYSIGNKVIVDFTNEGNYQFDTGIIEVHNLLGQKIVETKIKDFVKFETKVDHVSQIYIVKVIIDGVDYTKNLYIE
ncbi:MAG: hypothetical protein GQ564_00455 [Bacteroidales bacterium]|nr:hypothetical protein [Bacteroidales bacterium]